MPAGWETKYCNKMSSCFITTFKSANCITRGLKMALLRTTTDPRGHLCNILLKVLTKHQRLGFGIWGLQSHARASAHAQNIRDVQKKARFVWLKKLQGVRQIASLKEQRSLSTTFFKIRRSYVKTHVYLLFHWSNCENCIIFTFSLHKGRQASTN